MPLKVKTSKKDAGISRAVLGSTKTGGNSLPPVGGNEFHAVDASARVWNTQKPVEIRCRQFAGTKILRGGCVRTGLGSAGTGGNSLPAVGGNEFCAADTSARVWNRLEPAEIRCRRLAGTNFVRRMRPRGFGERKNRRKFLAAGLRERISCGGCVRAGLEHAKARGLYPFAYNPALPRAASPLALCRRCL